MHKILIRLVLAAAPIALTLGSAAFLSTPSHAAEGVATVTQASAAATPRDAAATAAAATGECAGAAWPYIPRACLASANGTPSRTVSRTIGFATR